MGKGHGTRQSIAGPCMHGINIHFLSPPRPPSVSGDQLFSTINTHVSTSGSLNYRYSPRQDSNLLIFNQAKGGDSLGPEHRKRKRKEKKKSAG